MCRRPFAQVTCKSYSLRQENIEVFTRLVALLFPSLHFRRVLVLFTTWTHCHRPNLEGSICLPEYLINYIRTSRSRHPVLHSSLLPFMIKRLGGSMHQLSTCSLSRQSCFTNCQRHPLWMSAASLLSPRTIASFWNDRPGSRKARRG
jgi:hypothetical protein